MDEKMPVYDKLLAIVEEMEPLAEEINKIMEEKYAARKHQMDITSLDKAMKLVVERLDSQKTMIKIQEEKITALERRIEHIECSLSKSKWIVPADNDPMDEMLKPTTTSPGGNPNV